MLEYFSSSEQKKKMLHSGEKDSDHFGNDII